MSFHFTDRKLKPARNQPQSQAQGPVYFCGSPLPPALPSFSGSLGSLAPASLRAPCVSVSSHHPVTSGWHLLVLQTTVPTFAGSGGFPEVWGPWSSFYLPSHDLWLHICFTRKKHTMRALGLFGCHSPAMHRANIAFPQLIGQKHKVQGQTPAVQSRMRALPQLQMAVLTLCPHRAREIGGVGSSLLPMGTVISSQRPTPMTSPPQGLTSKSPHHSWGLWLCCIHSRLTHSVDSR